MSEQRGEVKMHVSAMIVFHFLGLLKQVMMLANHSVVKDVCSHQALIWFVFFLFCCVKASHQTSTHLKKKQLFLPASSLTIHDQSSGVSLCNYISRSFVTALSQHSTCWTPKRCLLLSAVCQEESRSRHFAKTKTLRIQNRMHFCVCERSRWQCLFACSRVSKWEGK